MVRRYRAVCAGLISLSSVLQGEPIQSVLLFAKGDDRPVVRLTVAAVSTKPWVPKPGTAPHFDENLCV